MPYRCDDGNSEEDIEAKSPRAAARKYVSGGDWGDRDERSRRYWTHS